MRGCAAGCGKFAGPLRDLPPTVDGVAAQEPGAGPGQGATGVPGPQPEGGGDLRPGGAGLSPGLLRAR